MSDFAPLPEPALPPQPAPTADDWSLSDLATYIAMAAPCFILVSLAATFLVQLIGSEVKAWDLLTVQYAGFAAALLPLWVPVKQRFETSLRDWLRLRTRAELVVPSLVLGGGTALAVATIVSLLKPPQIETPLEEMLKEPVSFALIAIAGITLGPWFEEVFFRGILQPVLVRALGAAAGIVLAALPFAILHGPQYSWSWMHLTPVFAAGAFFGWRRYKTGSTGAAILMHSGYNSVLFIGALAAKLSGANGTGSI